MWRTTPKIHTYNANGQCTLCGAVNACKHAPAFLVEESYTEAEVISRNDEGHTLQYIGVIRYYACPACGNGWSEEGPVDNYFVTEAHHNDGSGICMECGYVLKVCQHENAEGAAV